MNLVSVKAQCRKWDSQTMDPMISESIMREYCSASLRSFTKKGWSISVSCQEGSKNAINLLNIKIIKSCRWEHRATNIERHRRMRLPYNFCISLSHMTLPTATIAIRRACHNHHHLHPSFKVPPRWTLQELLNHRITQEAPSHRLLMLKRNHKKPILELTVAWLALQVVTKVKDIEVLVSSISVNLWARTVIRASMSRGDTTWTRTALLSMKKWMTNLNKYSIYSQDSDTGGKTTSPTTRSSIKAW